MTPARIDIEAGKALVAKAGEKFAAWSACEVASDAYFAAQKDVENACRARDEWLADNAREMLNELAELRAARAVEDQVIEAATAVRHGLDVQRACDGSGYEQRYRENDEGMEGVETMACSGCSACVLPILYAAVDALRATRASAQTEGGGDA